MRAVMLAAALSSIVVSAFIVYTVAFEAAEFLTSVDLSSLVAIGWFPRRGEFDISTLLAGTLDGDRDRDARWPRRSAC